MASWRAGRSVQIRVTQHVRRSLPDVFAWCTDYAESDPGLSHLAIRSRTIVSRSPDVVELDDRGVLGMSARVRYVVRLHPPDRWEADAMSPMGTGHNEYRLSPDGGTTRIDVRFNLHPRGGYRILGAFAAPLLRLRLARLWSDFARDMEEGR